jgi:hypothetical protein
MGTRTRETRKIQFEIGTGKTWSEEKSGVALKIWGWGNIGPRPGMDGENGEDGGDPGHFLGKDLPNESAWSKEALMSGDQK